MKYKIPKGIACVKICGRYFLIVTKELWGVCPKVQEINEYAAFCWSCIEEGADRETTIKKIMTEYEVDRNEAGEGLDSFVGSLADHKYLMTD